MRTGSGDDVVKIQHQLGLGAIQTDDVLACCELAIKELPDAAQAVRQGNSKVIMKLVGKAMKLSCGRADAQLIRKHLEELLMKKDLP